MRRRFSSYDVELGAGAVVVALIMALSFAVTLRDTPTGRFIDPDLLTTPINISLVSEDPNFAVGAVNVFVQPHTFPTRPWSDPYVDVSVRVEVNRGTGALVVATPPTIDTSGLESVRRIGSLRSPPNSAFFEGQEVWTVDVGSDDRDEVFAQFNFETREEGWLTKGRYGEGTVTASVSLFETRDDLFEPLPNLEVSDLLTQFDSPPRCGLDEASFLLYAGSRSGRSGNFGPGPYHNSPDPERAVRISGDGLELEAVGLGELNEGPCPLVRRGLQLEYSNPSIRRWIDLAPEAMFIGLGALIPAATLRVRRRREDRE